jgi:hypothetical protein
MESPETSTLTWATYSFDKSIKIIHWGVFLILTVGTKVVGYPYEKIIHAHFLYNIKIK